MQLASMQIAWQLRCVQNACPSFPLGPGDTQSSTEHAWIDGQNSRPQAASNDLH